MTERLEECVADLCVPGAQQALNKCLESWGGRVLFLNHTGELTFQGATGNLTTWRLRKITLIVIFHQLRSSVGGGIKGKCHCYFFCSFLIELTIGSVPAYSGCSSFSQEESCF